MLCDRHRCFEKQAQPPSLSPSTKQSPGREELWASYSQPSLCSPSFSALLSVLGSLALWFQVGFGHRRHWQEIRQKEESELRILIIPPSPVILAPPSWSSCWLAGTHGYTSLFWFINKPTSLCSFGPVGSDSIVHYCDPQGDSPFLPTSL